MCNTTKYDYSKLRGKIKEVCGTQEMFANKIGLSAVSVSNKLNNLIPWKQEEIERTLSVLGINHTEIYLYFFAPKVEKNSTKKEVTHEN